jgi:hypothetical protein
MAGPGEYVPDVTEGITRVEDLPQPRIARRSRNYPARSCPRCGRRAGRYALDTRLLHDLDAADSERPRDLLVTFSRHRVFVPFATLQNWVEDAGEKMPRDDAPGLSR